MENVVARAVIVPFEGDHVPPLGKTRASRKAATMASVPVLENRSSSMCGYSCLTFSATRTESSAGKPSWLPLSVSWRTTASMTGWRAVSEDQRPVGHVQIDVLLSVDIPNAATFAADRHQRQVIGQHAHRAVVAASNAGASPFQKLFRLIGPLNSSVASLNHLPAALPKARPDVGSIKDELNRPDDLNNAILQGPSLSFHADGCQAAATRFAVRLLMLLGEFLELREIRSLSAASTEQRLCRGVGKDLD